MRLFLVDTANPIGMPQKGILDEKVSLLMAKWDDNLPEKSSWWKFWQKRKVALMAAVSFVVNCVDELVVAIDEFVEMAGKDKKATVLAAIAVLYDYVVREALPIWLKPIAGKVRYVVIYVITSYMIDFIVEKYKNGLWREDEKEQSKPGTDQ